MIRSVKPSGQGFAAPSGLIQRAHMQACPKRQIEIIANAAPKRDYYYQSRRGNRLFELGLGPVALAFAGASARQDHALMDELIAAHGEEEFAGSWLRAKGLEWAAGLIGTAHPQTMEKEDETTA